MTIIITNPVERTRFMKFATVGTMGAAIDFGVANMIIHFLGLDLVLAGTISFICAVFNNFLWNRHWTYPDSRSRAIHHQLVMFFTVSLVGICIRIPILHFADPLYAKLITSLHLGLAISTDFLARNITLATAVGIVMMWNFFANRYWTYNDVD